MNKIIAIALVSGLFACGKKDTDKKETPPAAKATETKPADPAAAPEPEQVKPEAVKPEAAKPPEAKPADEAFELKREPVPGETAPTPDHVAGLMPEDVVKELAKADGKDAIGQNLSDKVTIDGCKKQTLDHDKAAEWLASKMLVWPHKGTCKGAACTLDASDADTMQAGDTGTLVKSVEVARDGLRTIKLVCNDGH
jgi:hypothetical protein